MKPVSSICLGKMKSLFQLYLMGPFVPHEGQAGGDLLPFVPCEARLGETCFHQFALGKMKSLFHLYLMGSGWGRPASSICSFHPVGSGWTKPQGKMEFLLRFSPRRVRLGETCFISMHISPQRAGLDETSRAGEPLRHLNPVG